MNKSNDLLIKYEQKPAGHLTTTLCVCSNHLQSNMQRKYILVRNEQAKMVYVVPKHIDGNKSFINSKALVNIQRTTCVSQLILALLKYIYK